MSNKYKFSEEELKNIKDLYLSSISIAKISQQYNCSTTVIKNRLRKAGVNIRKTSRKYKCNNHYFSNINTFEKAYWLGFIMADGNITSSKQKVLTICLGAKDKNILIQFLTAIDSNHKIYEYNYKNPVVVIRIDSKQLHQDLYNLGCTPQKTKSLLFPKINKKFISSFVLGYLDGDGCICDSLLNKQIVFLGTKDILKNISKFLPFSHNVSIIETKGIYRLGIRLNINRALSLYSWLYSNNIYCLVRKRKILEQIIQKLSAT